MTRNVRLLLLILLQCVALTSQVFASTPATAVALPDETASVAQTAFAKALFQGNDHTNDLLWPLLVTNVQRCKRQVGRVGFRFFDVPQSSGDADAIAARSLGLELGVTVDHVVPGSPMAAAGLHVGDRILSIDGSPVVKGRHAGRSANEQLDRAIAGAGTSAAVTLQIDRGGQPAAIAAVPIMACDYTISPVAIGGPWISGSVGALDLDPGTLRAANDDTDRTIVLAHLLAHQLDGDQARNAGTQTTGHALSALAALTGRGVGIASHFGPAALIAGVAERGPDELRADALSVQLLQPVGIPADRVLSFWEHAAGATSHTSWVSQLTARHPVSDTRLTKLRALVADANDPTVQATPLAQVAH